MQPATALCLVLGESHQVRWRWGDDDIVTRASSMCHGSGHSNGNVETPTGCETTVLDGRISTEGRKPYNNSRAAWTDLRRSTMAVVDGSSLTEAQLALGLSARLTVTRSRSQQHD